MNLCTRPESSWTLPPMITSVPLAGPYSGASATVADGACPCTATGPETQRPQASVAPSNQTHRLRIRQPAFHAENAEPGTRFAPRTCKDIAVLHLFGILGPLLIVVGMVGSVLELGD